MYLNMRDLQEARIQLLISVPGEPVAHLGNVNHGFGAACLHCQDMEAIMLTIVLMIQRRHRKLP